MTPVSRSSVKYRSMTQSPTHSPLSRRSAVAVLVAVALALAGCADLQRRAPAGPVLPGGGTVPPAVTASDQIWVALSTATPTLTARLVDQLGQVVVPEAIARARATGRAVTLQIYATDEATAGHADELAQTTFPRVTADTNTLVAQHETAAASTQLFAQLEKALAGRPVAPAEDIVGALTLLADNASQIPDPQHHVLGVLLGDGLSSTNTCNTTLLPADNPQQVDAAAQECLAGGQLILAGVPIWLDGLGLDPTGGQLTSTQLDHAGEILRRIIERAGGRVCRAGPVLVPDPVGC